jgi:hypothetical protein
MDIIIILIIFGLFLAYGLWRGKNSLVSLVLCFYPALVLFSEFPYASNLIFWKQNAFEVSVSYLILFVIAFIFIRFSFHKVLTSHAYSTGGVLAIAIISAASTGFLLALQYHLPGLHNLHTYSSQLSNLLISPLFYFLWLIAPALAVLLFT